MVANPLPVLSCDFIFDSLPFHASHPRPLAEDRLHSNVRSKMKIWSFLAICLVIICGTSISYALHLGIPIEKSGLEKISRVTFDIKSRESPTGEIEFQITMSANPELVGNSHLAFEFDAEIIKIESQKPETKYTLKIKKK